MVEIVPEYDTVERDLERAGAKLLRLPSEAGVDWRLTLPNGEHVEAWEPGTNGLSPPAEITRLIERITAGRDLVPDPPPRSQPPSQPSDAPSNDYRRFEDLIRELVTTSRPQRVGSGAA